MILHSYFRIIIMKYERRHFVKNYRRLIWGMIFIIAAIVILLNSFNVITFDIFFDGWWTLFIIVPSLAGLIENKNKGNSIWGLIIGILLLLSAQDVLDFSNAGKLVFPILIACLGLKMISSCFIDRKRSERKKFKHNNKDVECGVAVFCGTDMDFADSQFNGAELVAVFGGIECNIKNARIDSDVHINVACVFGGVDIMVPDNVRVVSNVACVFGGVDVLKGRSDAEHTVYIDGVCLFGGIEVR